MGIAEKFVEKIIDSVIGLVIKKHSDDLFLIEETQKLIESMHRHYLECYRKYDGMLQDEKNLLIRPHPVLAEIQSDSVFGIIDRDKLNGFAQFRSSNTDVVDYMNSIIKYMCLSVEAGLGIGVSSHNAQRPLLLDQMYPLYEEPRNSSRTTISEWLSPVLGKEQPIMALHKEANSARSVTEREMKKAFSHFGDAKNIKLSAGLQKLTNRLEDQEESENPSVKNYEIYACREVITAATQWQRLHFEDVCTKYTIARRTLI